MTLSDIYDEIYLRLNVDSSNPFWDSNQILDAINEGYEHFVNTTECLSKFKPIQISSGVSTYDLPDDLIKLLWVGYDGRTLKGLNGRFLNDMDNKWLLQSGTPRYYTHSLGGIEQISLYLQPTDDGETLPSGDITLYEYYSNYRHNLILLYNYADSKFEGLSIDPTREPLMESTFHWAIVYYALYKLFRTNNEARDFGQSDIYKLLYADIAGEKMRQLKSAELMPITGGVIAGKTYNGYGPFFLEETDDTCTGETH